MFIYTELPKIQKSESKLKNNALFINTKGRGVDKLYFLGLDHLVDSYDTDNEIFTGSYRNSDNPRAIEDGKCSRSNASSNPVGVLQRNITLGANANSEFLVIAGALDIDVNTQTFPQSKATATRKAEVVLNKYRRAHAAENALEKVKKHWEEIANRIKINSPDDALNTTQNLWAKYQIVNLFNSPQDIETTSEIAEDIFLASSIIPDEAEDKLKKLIARQLKDGRTVKHQSSIDGSFHISEDVLGPAWLIIATANVINETGNENLLKERLPYYDGGESSVLEHLIRAAKHCTKDINERSLLEAGGKESNKLTSTVYFTIKELLPLLEISKEHHLVKTYQKKIDGIYQAFNGRMWDGSWYLAERNHRRVGSKKNQQRKIDLLAQTLPVSFGLTEYKKGEKAINNAWHHLDSPAGLSSFTPTFISYSPENPESSDQPGEKRNGGIDIKTAAMALSSETRLGRGDLAYKIFQQHSSIYRSGNQETYKIEPYYWADYLFGPASFKHGQGDIVNTTNACGWMYKNINEGILGIKPTLGGLKIDPCIPRSWRQVELSRVFRGAEYHIRILNPTRQTKGVDRIMIDGARLTGNTIKPFKTGAHFIEVFIG